MGTSMGSSSTEPYPGPSASTVTLARFVSTLGPGSLCFCCDSPLVPLAGDHEGSSLGCPKCGAKIVTQKGVVLQRAA